MMNIFYASFINFGTDVRAITPASVLAFDGEYFRVKLCESTSNLKI